MKSIFTAAMALTITAAVGFALDPPRYGKPNAPNANQSQVQKRGNGPQSTQGSKAGARNGKKAGPQDGSGPIHTPGTGGGNGGGRRGGGRR